MLEGGASVNPFSIERASSAEGGGGAPAAVAGPVAVALAEPEGDRTFVLEVSCCFLLERLRDSAFQQLSHLVASGQLLRF